MRRSLQRVCALSITLAVAACGQPTTGPAPSAEINALNPPASPAPTPEQISAALAALPAPYNTGDVDNGHAKFALCQACHTVIAGAPNMVGPNLHGVFGRQAGALESYSYSNAMKAAGWTWDAEHLDTWLTNPAKAVPGTKMTFAGLPNPKDRIDVIAYLKVASVD